MRTLRSVLADDQTKKWSTAVVPYCPCPVHLESRTMILFYELSNLDRVTIGNSNERDFWLYSTCSVQAGLQQ